MSARCFLIVAVCLTSWGTSAHSATAQPSAAIPNNEPTAKQRAIANRLLQPITLELKKVPLQQALKVLSIESGVEFVPDRNDLREAGINLDTPVTISVEKISMKSTLNLLLKPARLSYVIEDDVIKITTENSRLRRMIRKTYPVRDLVVPMPIFEGSEPGKTLEATLMQLIQNVVGKNSWEQLGGRGTIQYHALDRTLVINQEQEIHEEIEQLFASLRKLQDVTVQCDLRLIQVSSQTAKQWRKAMNERGKSVKTGQIDVRNEPMEFEYWRRQVDFTPNAPAAGPPPFVAFDEQHARRLLDYREIRIVQPPKVNIFNGEKISLESTSKMKSVVEMKTLLFHRDLESLTYSHTKEPTRGQPIVLANAEKIVSGWRCELLPIVSADRRSVRLNMAVEHFANDGSATRTLKATKAFDLADGSTLVWSLGELAREHLFVLVTPRIRDRAAESEAVRAEANRGKE